MRSSVGAGVGRSYAATRLIRAASAAALAWYLPVLVIARIWGRPVLCGVGGCAW